MSTIVEDLLLSHKFEKISQREDSYYFYKLIYNKEYLIFTYKDENEIFIKSKTDKAKRITLYDQQIEPFLKILNNLKRKEIIEGLLNK